MTAPSRPGEDHRLALRRWWTERCTPGHPAWVSREQAFRMMAEAGLRVIEHARLPERPAETSPGDRVVVYTDEAAHAGDGKTLMPWHQAAREHPGALCSRFVAPGGESWRRLKIGEKRFWLHYTAPDWRSNGGTEGDVTFVREENSAADPAVPGWPAVIWAVDYVREGETLYAIDLNPAPGIQATGVMHELSAFSVHGELTQYLTRHGAAFLGQP